VTLALTGYRPTIADLAETLSFGQRKRKSAIQDLRNAPPSTLSRAQGHSVDRLAHEMVMRHPAYKRLHRAAAAEVIKASKKAAVLARHRTTR
jgi:hypothetical protein